MTQLSEQHICRRYAYKQWRTGGCLNPPWNSEVLTNLSQKICRLNIPKSKKILLYEMKFLVPNYSCLQNPWLGGYLPQIPVLSVLSLQLNLLNPPPPKKFLLWTPHPKENSWVCHCLQVTEYLSHHYPNFWICHFGPQAQTARSPDIIPLNYFLWVTYKGHVLPEKLQKREEMLQRIMLSSDSRRGSYEVIQRTMNC
jgi:hypothetical protein